MNTTNKTNSTTNINTIPCLTWNWMKINKDGADLTPSFENVKMLSEKLPEGVTVITDKETYSKEIQRFSEIGSGCGNFANPKLYAEDHAPVPVEGKTAAEAENSYNHPLNQLIDKSLELSGNQEIIKVSGQIASPVIFKLSEAADGENCKNLIAAQNIIVEKDSKATFIFLYESKDSKIAQTQIIRTRVIAEENAEVTVIKVQLCGKNVNQIDDTAYICGENASAKFIQLELGGNHIDSGLHTTLSGYKSQFNSSVVYLCQENQYLDMNHIVYHYGKKSECNMNVNGTLQDNATKVYRGIIDLKKGCAGAKGHEMEETLLLNPKVTNKSLPVILCDEEDVEGTHGATIGRLSNDILFYMQTRGISQKAAEKIMARAKIQTAEAFIPGEEITAKIDNYLDNKFNQD